MTAPVQLFYSERKKVMLLFRSLIFFFFIAFPSGTPSSTASSFGARKKLYSSILSGRPGPMCPFSPLLPLNLSFFFSPCIKKISLYSNDRILLKKLPAKFRVVELCQTSTVLNIAIVMPISVIHFRWTYP